MTDQPLVDLPPRPEAGDVDWDTFVSYRHADRDIAKDLAQRLAARELRVFFDERGIQLGADWEHMIDGALDATRSCLVLVGATGVGGVQADEVRRALDRQARDPDFPVIVVLLPGAATDGFFAPHIAERSHLAVADAFTDDDVDRVAEAIRGLGLALPTGPERPNPYPGLRPFDGATAEVFFGRERDVDALVERAAHDALVAIVGPSGTGKSSVLLAGVLPRLAARAGDVVVTFRPGRHPRDAAMAALGIGGTEVITLADAVDRRRAAGARLVLAVDQLEEVVTRAADPAETAWLLDGLTALAARDPATTLAVVTVRSDRLGELNGHAAFGAALARATHLLGPLDADGLRDAIRRPAWSRNVGFQPGLVDEIVADLREQPNALPLLAVTLSEMWGHRRGDRLTIEAYQAVGRVGGALAKQADGAVAAAPRATVQRTLMRLVDVRADGGAVRRRRRRPDVLPDDAAEAALTSTLLDALVQSRLVIAGDDAGVPTYELAHDTLLVAWPLLARLVLDDRRTLELAGRLASATRDWVQRARGDDAVARGDALAELEGAVRDRGLAPTTDEIAFLTASRRAAVRARRRSRVLVGAAVAAVLAIVVAAVVAAQRNDALADLGIARRERSLAQDARAAAERDNAAAQAEKAAAAQALQAAQADRDAAKASEAAAQADRDAATAVRLLAEQRSNGIRLAVDAARRSTSRAAREAMATAMTLAPQPTLVRSLGRVQNAAFAVPPAGPVAVVQRGGSTIDRCQVSDGSCTPAGAPVGTAAVLRDVVADDDGRVAALGSDGTVDVAGWRVTVANGSALALQRGDPGVVVVGTSDGTVERWLVGTAIGGPIVTGARPVRRVAVSPVGRFLAIVEDGREGVRIVSLDGQPIADLRVGLGNVGAVAFTADRLLVADGDSGDVLVWALAGPLADGAPQTRFVGHDRPVVAMAVRDGALVTGDAAGTLRRWDIATTRAIGLPLPADRSASGDEQLHAAVALGIAADGASIAVVHRDGTLAAWPWDDRPTALTRSNVGSAGAALLVPTAGGVLAINGSQLVTPGGRSIAVPLPAVRFAAGLRDAVVVASDIEVLVISEATGDMTARWRASGPVTALAATLDRVAIGAADGTVAVLDASLRPVASPPPASRAVTAVALDPSGTRLAIGEGSEVRVVGIASGGSRVLRGHVNDVEALAFTTDGARIASGGDDRVVLVWAADDASAAPVQLVGHSDRVTGLVHDPSNDVLVSSSEDGTIRLWDRDGTQQGAAVRAGTARVDGLVLHRDRPAVSALSLGRAVTVELGDWDVRLCAIVGPAPADSLARPDGCR